MSLQIIKVISDYKGLLKMIKQLRNIFSYYILLYVKLT